MGDRLFRYNFDQADQFSGYFSINDWELISPAGKRICSQTATCAMWWKAFIVPAPFEDRYLRSETKYIFNELYSWFERRSLSKGNHPRFHEQFGKLGILGYAQNYFIVPKSVFTWKLYKETAVPTGSRIIKSLSSSRMNDGKTLFTTDVSGRGLDPSFPWFIQERIDATHDLTVFQVGQRLFGFTRSRAGLEGLDWRAEQSFDANIKEWEKFKLSDEQENKLLSLSKELSVNWGRYDFMINKAGQLVFLEFNANGQWVFLDYDEEYGLLDAVVEYLEP